jgi:hypothetical protein
VLTRLDFKPENTNPARELPKVDPLGAWRLGSEVGLLDCVAGFATVMASSWYGWQVKVLKEAMRHSKTSAAKRARVFDGIGCCCYGDPNQPAN